MKAITLILPTLLAGTVFGQSERPRLMLNTGGPVGEVSCVEFSPDSSQLYAAGSGKVVNVWNVLREEPLRAIPQDPLRWEISRGHRGVIYAMDVSASDGALAIGGISARGGNGDLVRFDVARRQFQHLLPRSRPDAGAQPGHVQSIVGVRFSPSGRQLVTMSIDGEVRLWTNDGADSQILQRGTKVTNGSFQTPIFLSETKIAYPAPAIKVHQRAYQLTVLDTTNQSRSVLDTVFWDGVIDISLSPDRKFFAAADHVGATYVFANDGRYSSRTLRPVPTGPGPIYKTVKSLAFGPRGYLAIRTAPDADGNSWLELWDTSANPPQKVSAGLPATDYLLGRGTYDGGCAFSPDDRLLAVSRADRSSVMLIPLRQAGATVDFAGGIELSGRGREPHGVAFVGDAGYRIAIRTDGVADPFQIDLETLQQVREPGLRESRPATATGWTVRSQSPTDDDRQEIQVFAPGSDQPQCTAWLTDTTNQGTYSLHSWLTDENGVPYGVAIATARMDGIFLYDLPADGESRLLRYLRDHTGGITAMSVSRDGRYLASSARDQTVKVWSLAGLRDVNQSFAREDAWGATFAVERDAATAENRLVVKSALGASIAAHRDLLAGDVIERIRLAGGVVEEDPMAMLRMLENAVLWQSLVISKQRGDQERQEDIVVVPGWEPLATFFLDRDGEWAYWTPQGVYNASAVGDSLFGWHLNVARNRDPEYYRAEKFREELEQPEVMRRLLTAGSLQDALVAVAVAQPRTVTDIAAALPQVRIDSPPMGASVPVDQNLTVTATVTYPPGNSPIDYTPRLRLNTVEVDPPTIVPQEVKVRGLSLLSGLASLSSPRGWQWWPVWAVYSWEVDKEYLHTWEVPPDSNQNEIEVTIAESDAVDARFDDAVVHVTAVDMPGQELKEQAPFNMYLLTLSAENYPKNDLPWCNNDAAGVSGLIAGRAGPHYRIDEEHIRMLNDETSLDDVSFKSVKRQIEGFKKSIGEVARNDLLVVFVAGHGQSIEQNESYYFLPSTAEAFDFEDENEVRKHGIPFQVLYDLADVKCRRLFLLDSCFSGAAAEEAKKYATREGHKKRAMVLSATSKDETAMQHPTREDTGLFTGVLIDGCQGMADGYTPEDSTIVFQPDGSVDLTELVRFVQEEVRSANLYQRPQYTPAESLDFVDLPLFKK